MSVCPYLGPDMQPFLLTLFLVLLASSNTKPEESTTQNDKLIVYHPENAPGRNYTTIFIIQFILDFYTVIFFILVLGLIISFVVWLAIVIGLTICTGCAFFILSIVGALLQALFVSRFAPSGFVFNKTDL